MQRLTGRTRLGFTLIELAIVLTIAGLLFVGLWRLLSGGNQQVRDQAAASQQQQLIAAVKAYLGSANGQTFMTPSGPGAKIPLPLPAAGACIAGQFCSYLPPGFTNATVNSYGQTYMIQVLKDGSGAGVAPTTYSFMIVTKLGDTIPDTSGGRISSFIGGDGGFLYTGNVCGALPIACGSYGGWQLDVTATYGPWPTAPAGGHIASRTFVSPSADSQFPWLAKQLLLPDPAYTWNTMTTDLYMGGVSTQGAGFGNIYMAPSAAGVAPTVGGSTLFMAGGTINLEGGTLIGTDTSAVNLTGSAATLNPLIKLTGLGSPTVNLLFATNGCTVTAVNPFVSNPAGCTYSISTDNVVVSGLVYANAFYAQTFIYQGSDVRLKTNIHPLTDALDDIMKLKPVSFTLKSNGKDSMGVIAQDLEKVYPQLVTKGEGMKAVNYDGLIGPLIGSVQELKKENDALRAELREQKQRQHELEQKIERSKSAPAP